MFYLGEIIHDKMLQGLKAIEEVTTEKGKWGEPGEWLQSLVG